MSYKNGSFFDQCMLQDLQFFISLVRERRTAWQCCCNAESGQHGDGPIRPL